MSQAAATNNVQLKRGQLCLKAPAWPRSDPQNPQGWPERVLPGKGLPGLSKTVLATQGKCTKCGGCQSHVTPGPRSCRLLPSRWTTMPADLQPTCSLDSLVQRPCQLRLPGDVGGCSPPTCLVHALPHCIEAAAQQ